jgi:hypothetical protein
MHRGRYIVVVLVALLVGVALPAAAIAQSAGEDQYTDPLQSGGSGSSGGGGGSSGGGSGSGGGGGSGGNAPATQSQANTNTAPTQATPAQADDSGGLPRTGFPVAVLVGAGLILLSGGLALRRPN